jgi:hypothetical protein
MVARPFSFVVLPDGTLVKFKRKVGAVVVVRVPDERGIVPGAFTH